MSRQPRQDRRLTKVLAALRSHGGQGRSPLYRWMRQHHDALAAAFAETPPAWGPLAAEMTAVGLTDADGKAPSAVSARQTWYRVRRDLDRARELKTPVAPKLAPDEIAPAVHAVTTPPPSESPRPRMSLDIRPARAAAGGSGLGSDSPPEPPGTTPAPTPEESPAEQMRRLLAAMEARKVPLPKVM